MVSSSLHEWHGMARCARDETTRDDATQDETRETTTKRGYRRTTRVLYCTVLRRTWGTHTPCGVSGVDHSFLHCDTHLVRVRVRVRVRRLGIPRHHFYFF